MFLKIMYVPPKLHTPNTEAIRLEQSLPTSNITYTCWRSSVMKSSHYDVTETSLKKVKLCLFLRFFFVILDEQLMTVLLHPVSYRLAFVYKKNSYFNSNLVLSIIHIKSKALINLLLLPIITSLIRFNPVRYIELRGYGYSVYFDVFFIFMVCMC